MSRSYYRRAAGAFYGHTIISAQNNDILGISLAPYISFVAILSTSPLTIPCRSPRFPDWLVPSSAHTDDRRRVRTPRRVRVDAAEAILDGVFARSSSKGRMLPSRQLLLCFWTMGSEPLNFLSPLCSRVFRSIFSARKYLQFDGWKLL